MPGALRGNVHWYDYGPVIGAELPDNRPALVTSNDLTNRHLPRRPSLHRRPHSRVSNRRPDPPAHHHSPGAQQTYTFFIYHQPFRDPQLSFRDVRHRGSSNARYIYAAEMTPYDPGIAAPTAKHNRRLKNVLLQEASRLSGFTLRETHHPWPISPPGTILATPLVPAR